MNSPTIWTILDCGLMLWIMTHNFWECDIGADTSASIREVLDLNLCYKSTVSTAVSVNFHDPSKKCWNNILQ